MSDDKKVPARAMTLRVGDEVFTDVRDYIILIRDSEDGLITRLSNHQWAHGGIISTLAMLDHVNHEIASHDCDEECGGDDE